MDGWVGLGGKGESGWKVVCPPGGGDGGRGNATWTEQFFFLYFVIFFFGLRRPALSKEKDDDDEDDRDEEGGATSARAPGRDSHLPPSIRRAPAPRPDTSGKGRRSGNVLARVVVLF